MTFRILLSYHYYRQPLEPLFARLFGEPPWPDTLADSGAFSSLTQGVHIDRDEYVAWLRRHEAMFDAYANLDVMHDPEATWVNQQYLEDQGLSPMPAFHVGEPLTWLAHYLERGYTYIALGGMVGRPTKAVMAWCVRAHQMAVEAGAVLHGFGLTRWEAVAALPWYSVDSSSWGSGYRYGRESVFDPERGRWHGFSLGTAEALAHRELLAWYGFTPEPFIDRSVSRADLAALSALSWAVAERYLRRRHGVITRPGADTTGLRTYLVDGSAPNLAMGAAGLRAYLVADRDGRDIRMAAAGLRIYLADTSTKSLRTGAAGVREHLEVPA